MLSSNLFRWTLVVSIIFHLIVVLGISFVMPVQAEKLVVGPPLQVTLVTHISDLVPEEFDTLAQANSLGEENPTAAAAQQHLQNSVSMNHQRSQSEPEQPDNFTTDEINDSDLSMTQSQKRQPDQNIPLTREQLKESINLSYMNAQSRPREKYVSGTRSKESKYAAYIKKWVLMAERVGNLNYPEAAKQQKLEGSLILDAEINADGNVNKVRILDSSGIKILDDAAIRIVHIAAPFDQFPDNIRAELDTLHIVRTWEFKQTLTDSGNRIITTNL